MSYIVLARKWRPSNFEDIVGQEHITRTLQNAIRANRIAHAFLFTGVRGVGKTTAARILAKALNCERGPTPTPCNQCVSCDEIAKGNCIDVLEIDGASNRGIDEIRQIIENVRYQPANCRFKIYIIDEVHQVTKDAFNALLKTLEEPPPSVKFILATTEPHRLPETILSRCQRFDFRRIALREIVQRLEEISRKEGLKITKGAIQLLAREADGSMRDAQSLLEQVFSFSGTDAGDNALREVDERLLRDIFGLTERRILFEMSRAVIGGDAKRCLGLIAGAVEQGLDLTRLSKDLVEHFRNLLVARLAGESGNPGTARTAGETTETQLLDLPDQEIADLKSQVAELPVDVLLDYFEFMAAGDLEIGRAENPRFSLETVMVRLVTLPHTVPVAQLIERLEQLEKRLSKSTPAALVHSSKGLMHQQPSPESPGPPEVKAGGAQQGGEDVWRDFIAFVAREKKLLATHLEAGSPIELGAGVLTIGVPERHQLNYLQDRDNVSALKTLADKYFSRSVTIRLTQVTPAERGVRNATEKQESSGESVSSDLVSEALRIFGGSIKAVRQEKA
jgi:DNA polymerase-3 subunit gamma/tau